LENLAFADGVSDFFFGDDFLLGEDFHSIYALGILFADLEDLAKSATTDELEELKVSWSESAFGLEMGFNFTQGRGERGRALYCSYVTWTRISPLTTSSSKGRSLGKKIDDQLMGLG